MKYIKINPYRTGFIEFDSGEFNELVIRYPDTGYIPSGVITTIDGLPENHSIAYFDKALVDIPTVLFEVPEFNNAMHTVYLNPSTMEEFYIANPDYLNIIKVAEECESDVLRKLEGILNIQYEMDSNNRGTLGEFLRAYVNKGLLFERTIRIPEFNSPNTIEILKLLQTNPERFVTEKVLDLLDKGDELPEFTKEDFLRLTNSKSKCMKYADNFSDTLCKLTESYNVLPENKYLFLFFHKISTSQRIYNVHNALNRIKNYDPLIAVKAYMEQVEQLSFLNLERFTSKHYNYNSDSTNKFIEKTLSLYGLEVEDITRLYVRGNYLEERLSLNLQTSEVLRKLLTQ